MVKYKMRKWNKHKIKLAKLFIYSFFCICSILNFDQLHSCIVTSLCSLRMTLFVQWIEHPICIFKIQTKDTVLNLMLTLKAVTSASSAVKLLKTKLVDYELYRVPSDWKLEMIKQY